MPIVAVVVKVELGLEPGQGKHGPQSVNEALIAMLDYAKAPIRHQQNPTVFFAPIDEPYWAVVPVNMRQ